MHKTDLIWGGTWGGPAIFWGACAPPGPPLATPLILHKTLFTKSSAKFFVIQSKSLEVELSTVKLHYFDKEKKTSQNTFVFLK